MVKKKVDISLKKQPRQGRSVATVEAIVESATYILRQEGARGFTANKVAEKAGVNIASFYQYFPNKQALLFHLAKKTWEAQLAKLQPLLTRKGPDHAAKLKDFIREFFLVEAAEADLRQALRMASIDLRDTKEFQQLISTGAAMTRRFIAKAVGGGASEKLDFQVDFIVTLVTSFAERTTDAHPSQAHLLRQADLLCDMLTTHFRIP